MAIKNEYVLNFKSTGVTKTKKNVDKLDASEKRLIATNKALEASTLALKRALQALGVATVVAGGYSIKVASEFEKLRTRLNTMYGSVNEGTKAFETFNAVAATTPFALQSVVEAGAQLKAFGLDAEDSIKPVADLAAFMGVDIVEAANSMGRAFAGGAGAADVLRERGVLNLIKEFKGVEDLTKLTLPQFREALLEAVQEPTLGIAGATDALAETFFGAYSNMWDSIDRLADAMGQKLLPTAMKVVRAIGDFANEMSGALNPLEQQIVTIQQQNVEMRLLVNNLGQATQGSDNFNNTIRRINREYPDLLANIDTENVNMETLKKNFEDVIKERKTEIAVILQKIKVEALEDKLRDVYKRQATEIENVTKQTSKLYRTLRDESQKFLDDAEVPDIVKNSLENMLGQLGQLRMELVAGDLKPEQFMQRVGIITDSMLTMMTMADKTTSTTFENFQNKSNEFFQGLTTSLGNMLGPVGGKFNELNDFIFQNIDDSFVSTKMSIENNVQALETFMEDYIKGGEGDEEIVTALSNAIDHEKQKLIELQEAYKQTQNERQKSVIQSQNIFVKAQKFIDGQIEGVSKNTKEVAQLTSEAISAVGISDAGARKLELDIAKYTAIGKGAKAIIDIWAEPGWDLASVAKKTALTTTMGAKTYAQVAMIEEQANSVTSAKAQFGGGKTKFAQYGMNEVVDSVTPIIAGEAGAELVQITPLEGANLDGPQGAGSIVITGNVLSRDFVQGELIDEIREAIRQGYDFR